MDDEGFLLDQDEWNKQPALWLMKQESEGPGVLSASRWQGVHALRIAGWPNPREEFKACLKANKSL